MKIKTVVIGDIHFGEDAKSQKLAERTRDELRTLFFPYLKDNDVQVVIINGDYFHTDLYMSDNVTNIALDTFIELTEICIEKNIKLRVIHGTEGHDAKQTRMFEKFRVDGLDMEIYENVTDEVLFEGFEVLFVPEESMKDPEEFYRYYRKKSYALMAYHGYWDLAAPSHDTILNAQNKELLNSPVLLWDEWKDTLKYGIAINGHLHKRCSFKQKIYYPGSFTCYSFADISKRGFAVYDYDTETKEYKFEYVNNTMCPVYKTMNLNELELPEDFTVEEFMTAIEPKLKNVNFLRVDITEGVTANMVEILKGFLSKHPTLKIANKMKSIVTRLLDSQSTVHTYSFVLSAEPNTPSEVVRVTGLFIKHDFKNKDGADEITLDEIDDIIFGDFGA